MFIRVLLQIVFALCLLFTVITGVNALVLMLSDGDKLMLILTLLSAVIGAAGAHYMLILSNSVED